MVQLHLSRLCGKDKTVSHQAHNLGTWGMRAPLPPPLRRVSMTGRGAWNNAGVGGTEKYKDATKPGPYYYLGSGEKPVGRGRDANEYAVYRAVIAYQRALNRALPENVVVDGYFGEKTSAAVTRFQEANKAVTGTPWGGIGPESSKALLLPLAKQEAAKATNSLISTNV